MPSPKGRGPRVRTVVKRVPELVPPDVAQQVGLQARPAGADRDRQGAADYDAIIFGTPTRFGNMTAQMRNFLDQTGGLWAKGSLVGKVGVGLHLERHPARRPGDAPS